MKKHIAPQIIRALAFILLSAITLTQSSLAQGDSEDESDLPSVRFEDSENKKKPNCACNSPRSFITDQEKAPSLNGRITPRLSLENLPKEGISPQKKPSSSKEKNKENEVKALATRV